MTVWTRFKDLVDRVAGHEKPARNFHEDELRLAAAALLVRASMIDGQVDAVERRKLKALLQERFDLWRRGGAPAGAGGDGARRRSRSIFTASPACFAASSTRTAASGSSRCCGKW